MTGSNKKPPPNKDKAPTSIAQFSISFYQQLDTEGKLCRVPPTAFAKDYDHLRELYHCMAFARAFDKRAISLQRTGQLGTYASCLGQEAVGAALGDAMAESDVLLPTYRETPALFMRGVTPLELLLYWGGDERGMAFVEDREDFPICIPIASHAPHAAGVAFAFKYRSEARAAVCVIGDGATSKGDFYEALNVAGAWRLPVLFLVVNNQWAISVPREGQSSAQTLAQKAIAAGIDCEQVDGNDLLALLERLGTILAKVRQGEPYLIEALTYRLADHTTADDASRYRTDEVLKQQWRGEPMARLRSYLEQAGQWDQSRQQRLDEDCGATVEAAVEAYLATPPPPPEALFKHLYADLPACYQWQLQQANEGERGCG